MDFFLLLLLFYSFHFFIEGKFLCLVLTVVFRFLACSPPTCLTATNQTTRIAPHITQTTQLFITQTYKKRNFIFTKNESSSGTKTNAKVISIALSPFHFSKNKLSLTTTLFAILLLIKCYPKS